ncbi:MAG TPA: DUF4179 domain-containing protein [Clostridium sp.]|uniref:DUF4179 domain-containing protein n=2 Tax=Acetivibrio mesophilus TaxID=2487273 RepID=A0A4Q0I4S9_9FIRM|nr:hypothetical protein A7W90_11835 [Clostridium sp. Bc-iso-3]RXE59288.1 DUF4179 domain-containing protein [Acetivibrio mesophilus]HHV28361.1 DUF4179 domain-containing protein [Clostridium sp.]
MFREKYRIMNEQISPDQELVDKITRSIPGNEKETNKGKNLIRKPVAILAMLSVLVLTITPVIAKNASIIYGLMYYVAPDVAQFFVPIQKSCEDNGIKMEVVSAYIHDNVAEIYITMQDLVGERIDGTIDLYDSYSINRPFDSFATCELVGYDETTKTATFLISITEWGNKKIVGDKVTFSVREFISDKRIYNEIPIPVDLTNISDALSTKEVSPGGGGGPKIEEYYQNYESRVKVLVPSAPMQFPVEGIDFTGIGYIDGMLHIQTSVVNNLTKDNHGYFFLRDKSGNEVQCIYNVSFSENIDTDNRVHYDEYVFEIPKSEIGQYSLYGTFVTSGLYTRGNWQVTFPLEQMNDKSTHPN